MNDHSKSDLDNSDQRKRRLRRALIVSLALLVMATLPTAVRVPHVVGFSDESREVIIPIPPDLEGWEGVALAELNRSSLWPDIIDCLRTQHALGFVDDPSGLRWPALGTSEGSEGGVFTVGILVPLVEVRRFAIMKGRFAASESEQDERLRQSIEEDIEQVVTHWLETSFDDWREYAARSVKMRNELLALIRSISRESSGALTPRFGFPAPGGWDQRELQYALEIFNALLPLAPLTRGRAPIEVYLASGSSWSSYSRVLDLESVLSEGEFLSWLDRPSAREARLRSWNLLASELSDRSGVQVTFTPRHTLDRGPNPAFVSWVTEIVESCAETSVETIALHNHGRSRGGNRETFDWRLTAKPAAQSFGVEDDGSGFPPVEEVIASFQPPDSDPTAMRDIVRWNAGFEARTGLELVDLAWREETPYERRKFLLSVETVLPELKTLELHGSSDLFAVFATSRAMAAGE